MTHDHQHHSRIVALTDELTSDLIALRRTLHANPELGFEEFETSALIKSWLDRYEIPWRDGYGKTGVAADIGAGNGRLICIRGDMDALPIQETSDPDYKSRNPGKMHACGHDAHTAIAVGVAAVLAQMRDDLPGRAMVIFQPAEEGLGGARAMLEDGVFEASKPDIMLGYHNWPLIPGGTIGWHPKTAFASTDPFDVVIRGKSGHGAHPHLAVDPILAAAACITALQTVISREIAPLDAGVISIGSIQGGTARNQIPDEVRLQGTTRSQSPEVRDQIIEAIKRVCDGISNLHRVDCQPEFLDGVGPVINDAEILGPVIDETRHLLGDDKVVELPQGSMGSEDYAEFSSRFPSAHLRIGSKIADRSLMLHRSDFDVDETCIPTAIKTLVAASIRLMTLPANG